MRTSGGFALWALAGAAAALGVLTVLTVGVFVLPAALVLGGMLAWRGPRWLAAPGIVAGLSLPLLYVGYLNRSGPGMVCTASATSQLCTQEWSPWPWLAAGLLLLLGGLVLGLLMARRRQRAEAGP